MRNGIRKFLGMKYSAESGFKYLTYKLNKELLKTSLIGYRFYYSNDNGHEISLYYFNNLMTMKSEKPQSHFYIGGMRTSLRLFSMYVKGAVRVDFEKESHYNLFTRNHNCVKFGDARNLNFSISDKESGILVGIDLEKIYETMSHIWFGTTDDYIDRISHDSIKPSITKSIPSVVYNGKPIFVALTNEWIDWEKFYNVSERNSEIKLIESSLNEIDDFILKDLEQHLNKNISDEVRNDIKKTINAYAEKKQKEKLKEEIRKNDELAIISLKTVKKNYLEE